MAEPASSEVSKIGFIGLGAMGHGMAASLLRAGHAVRGFDVYEPAIERFLSIEGKAEKAGSATEAVRGAEMVFLMVQNAAQVDDLLFGTNNAAESLLDNAIVVLSSTVPPSFVKDLENRLKALGKDISLVDAPVSGGVVRAANGTLTVSVDYLIPLVSCSDSMSLDYLFWARLCHFPSQRPVDGPGWNL